MALRKIVENGRIVGAALKATLQIRLRAHVLSLHEEVHADCEVGGRIVRRNIKHAQRERTGKGEVRAAESAPQPLTRRHALQLPLARPRHRGADVVERGVLPVEFIGKLRILHRKLALARLVVGVCAVARENRQTPLGEQERISQRTIYGTIGITPFVDCENAPRKGARRRRAALRLFGGPEHAGIGRP